ncbi:MAG: uracil-DNA glycosylase, partial [Proteobacteria bacterium]|nr:uracil-DNA glycosylase [Pseudomonadota bacterium]
MLSRDDVFSELGIGPAWRLRETSATPAIARPSS